MAKSAKRTIAPRFIALLVATAVLAGIISGCDTTAPIKSDVGAPASASTAPDADTASDPGGLYKLTQDDILEIYSTQTDARYKDDTMSDGVKPSDLSKIQLTDEEKDKIRAMNLTVAIEQDHLDDAMKLAQQAIKDQCADLNITVKDVWIATAQDGASQMTDYQRIEAIAQNYDCIFTAPSGVANSSEILKKIMKKTKVGYLLSVPFDLDWNDPNFAGISDIDAYQAGVYSAKAAIKILNGQGTLGTIGYINGHTGAIQTCAERYRGWDDVFAQNPDIKVVQEWFDDPAQSKAVTSGLLSANPNVKVLLIDWANPPADQAQQAFKERGLVPWKDISLVTIDMDNTITVPMALDGPNNNYAGAFISQTWYSAGANLVKQYAKHLLYGNDAPKYVVSPPLPVTTYDNMRTHFEKVVPATGFEIPKQITELQNQWPLGVEDIW